MTAVGDSGAGFRRTVYCLLIVTSVASMAGRVLSVRSPEGRTPLLSANDRSRWSMIRALVDHGTFQIDDVVFAGERRNRDWYTIDMVRHRGRDGREHYYSSKPPLFAMMVAAKYWLLQQVAGISIAEHPFYVVRALLLTTNVLPLLLFFLVLMWLVERIGTTDWGRIFVMTAATWGTFLTTFAVTLNNHLPAAISALIAVYAFFRMGRDHRPSIRHAVMAGGFAAFSVVNELPALSFFVFLGLGMLVSFPRQLLLGFVPSAALVLTAFLAANYAAHESWRPPYAHRGDGPVVGEVPSVVSDLIQSSDTESLAVPKSLKDAFPTPLDESAVVSRTSEPNRYMVWDPRQQKRWALVPSPDDSGMLKVCSWDNWYEYEGSYWTDENRRGVDRGEASQAVYAFHMSLGHRGILSLTPIWLFSLAGLGIWLRRGDHPLRALAALTLALLVVCVTFYILRPQVDRNYGGVAAGFRWLFWQIPLWLLAALPAADAAASRRSLRAVAWSLMAISVLSASYAAQNPWSHSWIYDYWTKLGWLNY